jgi:hypothetical protein
MTPRRWTPNNRVWAYRYLALRDGDYCALCGKLPTAHNNPCAKAPTAQNTPFPKAPITHYTLDIDHIDGDPTNCDPDNLRLLCRSCNVAQANKARSAKSLRSVLCVRERKEGCPATRIAKEDCNYREASPEMQANTLFEVPFRRWILQQVTTNGGYDKTAAINEGAELVGCSPTTTTRYLAKLTSPSGPLTEIKDALGHRILVLKPHLQNPVPRANV